MYIHRERCPNRILYSFLFRCQGNTFRPQTVNGASYSPIICIYIHLYIEREREGGGGGGRLLMYVFS